MQVVSINNAAINALLESPDGPIGKVVQQAAQRVVLAAQQNVRTYFGGAPSLEVDKDIEFIMDGSTAIIGIKDAGSKARRLAQYQSEGRVNWLRPALEAARA